MKTFASLLDALIAAPPDRRDAIEELILSTFQRKRAVLALDMSGFTLAVRRDGILAYLCQIRRMQKLTRPIVLAFGGEVVKNEADNLLAVFEDKVRLGKLIIPPITIPMATQEKRSIGRYIFFDFTILNLEFELLQHLLLLGNLYPMCRDNH